MSYFQKRPLHWRKAITLQKVHPSSQIIREPVPSPRWQPCEPFKKPTLIQTRVAINKKKVHNSNMEKEPDLRNITAHLGVSDETVARWREEGLLKGTPLPPGATLRRVTPEDLERRAAEGTLYEPWPEGLLQRLAASVEEKPEPPTSA
jgi:hypothetical protein